MRLADLLDRVNLPDVIARECGPEAVRGLNRDRGGVIRDPRPAHRETHPSFSVFRDQRGRWRWKRHGGDGASGDALAFLGAMGYQPDHAWEELARHAGVTLDGWQPAGEQPVYRAPDPLREARAALDRCAPLNREELSRTSRLLSPLTQGDAATRDLQRRGLSGWKDLQVGKLREPFITRDGHTLAHSGALGLLISGPDGQPWGLKVRNLGTADTLRASSLDRYMYRIGRHGAPAWCSPGYGQGDGVLIVEGELNGAAASRALSAVGSRLDVQGLAGAGGVPFLHSLQGSAVLLYADRDEAGAACLERVGRVACAAGAREVRVLAPLHDGDFSDLCGKLGAPTFGDMLLDWVYSADYFQTVIPGNITLPTKNAALSEERGLLANWQSVSDWGAADPYGWGGNSGGWGADDRGGW